MRPFLSCFSSFWGKLLWKMCPLVLGEILGVFVYILTADGKYPVQGFENWELRIQMQLSLKRKLFPNFLKEKMIFIANVFAILQTGKIFVRKLIQGNRFRTGFGSQHVKTSKLLAKSPWECFYHLLFSFSGMLVWNMSPLVFGEILVMILNTLTGDGKNPIEGCENLQLPIQMELSAK